MNEMCLWGICEIILTEKTRITWRKTCIIGSSSTKNRTSTGLGSKLGCDRPATNHGRLNEV